VAALHRAFAHKRSTLTSVLDRLNTRGLITRESSLKDRRSFLVKLTASGKKPAARIHRQLESLEAQVLRANDRRAVDAFGQVIRNLESAAEE
jgi:DNA-binding MarR family transcriptional regulator